MTFISQSQEDDKASEKTVMQTKFKKFQTLKGIEESKEVAPEVQKVEPKGIPIHKQMDPQH